MKLWWLCRIPSYTVSRHQDQQKLVISRFSGAHLYKYLRRLTRKLSTARRIRSARLQAETPADKAARQTARGTVWMALFTFIIVVANFGTLWVLRKQLKEMHDGGVDTHNLAVAATNQATWTQRLAGSAGAQSQHMSDLADHMKDVADKTEEVAKQDLVQARAAEASAKAAATAADIAGQTLHVSERAFLTLGVPVDDFTHNRTNVPIVNSGHIPSGPVTLIVHEATFRVDDPKATFIPAAAVIEKHWRKTAYETIPNGNLISAEVHLPAVVEDQVKTGKQVVAIAAVMTYNDGFPNTQEQRWVFCDQSGFDSNLRIFLSRPCDDANLLLHDLIQIDGYPNIQTQEK